MELASTLQKNIILNNNSLEKNQNSFLQSSLWKVINAGLNTGIRALLPNFIEDQVIEIKDAIIDSGFKAGAKQAVTSAIDLGKTATGIVTGNFENISQAQNAIKSGGLIDSVSKLLNTAVNAAVKNNLISSSIGDMIKKGKNVILNTVESNLENSFTSQLSSIEKLSKYTQNWQKYYQAQDLKSMEKEYKKIKQTLKETLPLENILKQARTLENLHLLIKNNGQNFDISKEEKELAEKLAG